MFVIEWSLRDFAVGLLNLILSGPSLALQYFYAELGLQFVMKKLID
jgi:hypothetical protein